MLVLDERHQLHAVLAWDDEDATHNGDAQPTGNSSAGRDARVAPVDHHADGCSNA